MRSFHKLSAATLARALAGQHPPARLADGAGLYLSIRSALPRWLFRYKAGGRQHYVGLGRLIDVPARVARVQAAELRAAIGRGEPPHLEAADEERTAPAVRTLAQAVAEFMATRPSSKHPAHARQWIQTLADYVVAPLGAVAIAALSRGQVIAALAPIWRRHNHTGRRTLSRLRRVLDREIALGHIEQNVALLGPIQAALGVHRRPTRHHKAMVYSELPAFMRALAQEHGVAAEALRFLVLCACRTGELRGLRWRHVDLTARLWTVPTEESKTGRLHTVPLSSPALAILRDVGRVTDDGDPDSFVFPGESVDGRLSANTLLEVMKRHGWGGSATPHGMRSAFRTWCAKTGVKFEIAEEALAHLVGSATERAYERPDYFDERRVLMAAWGRYVTGARK